MHWIDWAVVGAYILFAISVGVYFARRASQNVDEFFLSGRSLPWWIAGTSMVATTFAADTPLVVTGWVRDAGIWKNWLWWCYAISGMLGVFIFARWWRRGEVMTKAELVELRYGGVPSQILRALLGAIHASITNTIVLCWVLLAAGKIFDVLFGVGQVTGILLGCVIALSYSLLAGFWGVVITDLVQFLMAVVGAIALAVLSWNAVGGGDGVMAAAIAGGSFTADTLRFVPAPGDGGPFDASFWTVPVAALAVYLGVWWWAAEGVDGSSTAVQRICASRDERQGMLAVLWYNLTHYAVRPWPWIMVALASLIVLPNIEVQAPIAGRVVDVSEEAREIAILAAGAQQPVRVSMDPEPPQPDWKTEPKVAVGDEVEVEQLVARTDSERAYVVMMRRYLPVGLLGLVVASLIAAFMSTIDTHINLAASFFVNDIYRRFLAPGRSERSYVLVARITTVVVLAIGALLASASSSISDLFQFFLALLGGVGPVYLLRWLWWRITAWTEIIAMIVSVAATLFLTFGSIEWSLGPFSEAGDLTAVGRQVMVVMASGAAAMLSVILLPTPTPATLVPFYRRVRPAGAWGPVRVLAPDVTTDFSLVAALVGSFGGLGAIFGVLFGTGYFLLGDSVGGVISLGVAAGGGIAIAWSLRHVADPRPSDSLAAGDPGSAS